MKKGIIICFSILLAITGCKKYSSDYVWDPDVLHPKVPVEIDSSKIPYKPMPFGSSAIQVSDSLMYLFYSYAPGENYTGSVNYKIVNIYTGRVYEEKDDVLTPGDQNSWDNEYVGDPKVLMYTSVTYQGHTYSNVMYYTGTSKDHYYSQIGVAMADSINQDTWVKFDKPLIPKPWEGDDDLVNSIGGWCYGVGQPSGSCVGDKGRLLISYTYQDDRVMKQVRQDIDLSDMSNINYEVSPMGQIPLGGIFRENGDSTDFIENIDFAWDYTGPDMFYMIRPIHAGYQFLPAGITHTLQLVTLPGGNFWSNAGIWQEEGKIDMNITGHVFNHTACLVRNGWGGIDPSNGVFVVHYVSDTIPGQTDENYYLHYNYKIAVTKIE